MSDHLPARRGDGLDRARELPSALHDAILQAGNLIAAVLPPGVQLELQFEDNSDLRYSMPEVMRALIDGGQAKAVVQPGRLQVRLVVQGREGWFAVDPATAKSDTYELEVTAEGQLVSEDGSSFTTIILDRWDPILCVMRPWR